MRCEITASSQGRPGTATHGRFTPVTQFVTAVICQDPHANHAKHPCTTTCRPVRSIIGYPWLGADLNATAGGPGLNVGCETALINAAKGAQVECARLLLEAGATTTLRVFRGRAPSGITALEVAENVEAGITKRPRRVRPRWRRCCSRRQLGRVECRRCCSRLRRGCGGQMHISKTLP